VNNSRIKAGTYADPQDSAVKRLKTPFKEQQARNKEKIIIITLQGTILNENQEIPNTAVFLSMMKKTTGLKMIYLGGIPAKEKKQIKKFMRNNQFPQGRIYLQKKNTELDDHYLEVLLEHKLYYDCMVITSNEKILSYCGILGISSVKTPENTEWDCGKRQEIIRKCGCIGG